MKTYYDVIVIGAGTAGSFFARKMAEQGYTVAVFDKLPEKEQGSRLGVFHTDKERFAPYGVPEPKSGDEDYLGIFEYGITKSAFDNYPKRADYPFLILHFAPFLKRLRNWAAEKDTEYYFDADFSDFQYDDEGNIKGAVFNIGGETITVNSKLVADCSGIPSVARRKLKNSRVETFEISPRDMFYVVLHYVKLKNPDKDIITYPTGYAQYKSWYAAGDEPGTCVFGTGANLSFDYAKVCHERFRNAVQLPEHEYIRTEYGVTPYRRPPYSMVDNGFICMGDTACMTKPFSGEGISSGWVGCDLAAQVASKAMKDGEYPTEAALWEYNLLYAKSQGADFANIMAMLVNAVDCTAEENEYEFKKDIVFTSKQLTRTNRTFSADMPVSDSVLLVLKVIVGVLSGNISVKSVRNLLKGVLCGMKLKSHYKNYPASPDYYEKWAEKAEKLWTKTGNMADVVEKLEKQFPTKI